jgi:hypothetical protein
MQLQIIQKRIHWNFEYGGVSKTVHRGMKDLTDVVRWGGVIDKSMRPDKKVARH